MPSGESGTETIFMSYQSIRGEALVPIPVEGAPGDGWMQLTTCSFGGRMNYGATNTERAAFEGEAPPILIGKRTDASSVGLIREALNGTFDKEAVIVFLRTGTDGPEPYLRLELSKCGITEFDIAGSGEDRSGESYRLRFQALAVINWGFDDALQQFGPSAEFLSNEV